MEIIFSREVAEGLRERYTVLELETFDVEGKTLETFCVVPAEKLMMEMGQLTDNVAVHNQLIQSLKENNNDIVVELSQSLKGKFGGELDSFYDILLERLKPST
jgi:hypothetical protein